MMRKRWGLVVILLALALLAQGCGGVSSQIGGGGAGQSMGGSPDGGGAVADDLPTSGSGGRAMTMSSGAEMASAAVAGRGEAAQAGLDLGSDRMIVKTAELGIETDAVRADASAARDVAAGFGGDVLSSRVYGGRESVTASLVLTVPSGEFEAALDELRGLGRRVTSDTVTGQDVTEEFVDLESRERNLLAAEQSLLTLYERAEDVGDTLQVQRELTDVRGQIEEVQGRIQYLEDRTATARISLNIEPLPTAPPKPQPWSPSVVAARAWDASLGVLQAGATVAISAAVFSWWLLPIVAAGFLLWRRYGPVRSDPSG